MMNYYHTLSKINIKQYKYVQSFNLKKNPIFNISVLLIKNKNLSLIIDNNNATTANCKDYH